MKIVIVGSGYVGLVSGICFAKLGHDVVCVDNDKKKINSLNQNIIPIFEPNLEDLLREARLAQKISFTTDLALALSGAKAVFIAVGTPQGEDGDANLSYVYAVAEEVARLSTDYKLLIAKSTVPVGTGDEIAKIIARTNPNSKLVNASNPEFLREGSAIEDFMHPDRIVVGVKDEESKKIMAEIYQNFAPEKIVYTDVTTAEMIKYAANSFLATKISFINEMADLCEKTGADIKNLAYAIGLDSRIGAKFLNPGPGFGGSCFPKDIMAIINVAKNHQVDLSLISSVIASNKERKFKMAQKILAALNGEVSGKRIAFLGLAFKANTDDVRYSPAIAIIKEVAKTGALIVVSDPEGLENSRQELLDFNNIEYFSDPYQAITGADLLVIATEWKNYANLDLEKVKKLLNSNKIVDLRNLFDVERMRKSGFEYSYIGGKI